MPALTGNVYEMANKTGGLNLKNILQPGERYQTYLKDKESYNQTQAKRLGIELPEKNTQPQTAEPSPFESRIQSALDTVRLWRGPDYVFTDAESKTLETLLSGSDNPDEVFSRFISSTALAGMSGYDVKTVYDNLDQISQFYTGKDYMANDATLFEKVNASFKTIQAQKIMAQYKDAYVSGDYEKASEYEAQAQAILDEIGDTLAGVPQNTLDAIGDTLLGQTGYIYCNAVRRPMVNDNHCSADRVNCYFSPESNFCRNRLCGSSCFLCCGCEDRQLQRNNKAGRGSVFLGSDA